MTVKNVVTTTLGLGIAFGLGVWVGSQRAPEAPRPTPTSSPSPPPAVASPSSDDAVLIAALRRGTAAQQKSIDHLQAELNTARLAAAEAAARHPAVDPGHALTLGVPRYQLQKMVLNNLRQIAAARESFYFEQGRAPTLQELVGPDTYVKQLRTTAGEDYSVLSMQREAVLTVLTPDGISITYDPFNVGTTRIEYPPEIQRLEDLSKKLDPSMQKALQAYRAANGVDPSSDKALLPYFATLQEGADYAEFLEAVKAVKK